SSKPAQATTQTGPTRRGGIVTMTTTLTDTGERKQMFGLTARHIKSTMTGESTPEACSPFKMKVETDGWYVDLQYGIECATEMGAAASAMANKADCVDEYRNKTVGTAKLGYPLLMTMTIYGEDGRQSVTSTTEVLELTSATLDPALFEIPSGYSEAKSTQEFYAAAAAAMSRNAGDDTNRDSNTASAPATSAPPSSGGAATVPGTVSASSPKKAGAVRIGLVMPKAQMSDNIPAANAAEAVRNTFAGYLNGPTVEVVLLSARLPVQAIEEARQSQCDYILFAGITQKKGGGGGMFGKVLGNVAGTAASSIPYGGSTGEAVARSAASAVIYNSAMIASSIKAKDELSLDYKFQATEGDQKPLVANTTNAKAKSDGEDVITPLIEKAAEAIVTSIQK
ncbi:MAG TPA: hypothetical protein VNH22_05015, partial [Blastocatellia bacterium]|nr:hypothetical protein [Blastocatellia bacterium]